MEMDGGREFWNVYKDVRWFYRFTVVGRLDQAGKNAGSPHWVTVDGATSFWMPYNIYSNFPSYMVM